MRKMYDTRTHEERALGRKQRYVHTGVDTARYQTWQAWHSRPIRKNPEPMKFRKPKGLSPVKGGRWGVRKLACDTKGGWQWEAYCNGTMKGATGRFPTQKLAVEHAQRMALVASIMRR